MDLYSFIKVFAQIYEVAEGRGGGGREKRFEDTQKEKRWAVTATVATVKRWVAMERSGGGGRERWWRKGEVVAAVLESLGWEEALLGFLIVKE